MNAKHAGKTTGTVAGAIAGIGLGIISFYFLYLHFTSPSTNHQAPRIVVQANGTHVEWPIPTSQPKDDGSKSVSQTSLPAWNSLTKKSTEVNLDALPELPQEPPIEIGRADTNGNGKIVRGYPEQMLYRGKTKVYFDLAPSEENKTDVMVIGYVNGIHDEAHTIYLPNRDPSKSSLKEIVNGKEVGIDINTIEFISIGKSEKVLIQRYFEIKPRNEWETLTHMLERNRARNLSH